MTKIKNFRLTPRPREMARWLKRERGLETTPELELALEQITKDAKQSIETAAIYTTLTRQVAEKTTPLAFPHKSIAVSIAAVSIGPALGTLREASHSDALKESLLSALHQEALSQSLHFVVRLVQDQAKEEDCDMSPPVSIEDLPNGQAGLSAGKQGPDLASSLAILLGVQRIGIALDASIPEIPPHVRVAWLFWTPIGKAANRRAEKVAA